MKLFLSQKTNELYPTLKERLEKNFQVVASRIDASILIEEINSFSKEEPINETIIISNKSDLDNILFLNSVNINHLIGASPCLEIELERVIRKIQNNNLFGIEKYLNEDAFIHSTEIIHSKDTPEEIDKLLSKFNYEDVFSSPKDNLRIVLNELIMNAFFHQTHLIDKNRKNSVFVSSEESVSVKLAMDSSTIAILVKDNIGSINKENVLSSIKRGFVERRPRVEGPGAGLGLMMVFENINQLHINNKKDQFCEFVGIIDISKRYKNFKERITSFHYFEEE